MSLALLLSVPLMLLFYLRHSLVKVQQLESEGDGLLSSGNA
jgi:hypothetical protein